MTAQDSNTAPARLPRDQMMASVSVIVVNWNTAQLLERCLSTLLDGESSLELEVWVVDNASSDQSVAMVRDRFPNIHLIENKSNLGFARANNQGIREAQGEYILLLNSDAFLTQAALAGMLERMQAAPACGAMGCRLVYEDQSLQRSCQSFPTLATELWQCLTLDKLFPSSRVFGKYLMTWWGMDDFREVDVVMGAVMLLRRQGLEQVGLLDEGFFMYSEEVDLCYRLKKAGWQVWYLPDVQATHLWGGSSRQVPAATLVRLYQSRVQFFRKHYGRLAALAFKGILYLESLLRVLGGYSAFLLMKRAKLRDIANGYAYLFPRIGAF